MGEIAEMMLDGTLCEGCGVFLNAEPTGYPCYCSSCASERKASRKAQNATAHQKMQAEQKKIPCAVCGRKVKTIGMPNHMKDAHPERDLLAAAQHEDAYGAYHLDGAQ
jgi:Zn finger protein HypA/HybF involved in hydrogenase expression